MKNHIHPVMVYDDDDNAHHQKQIISMTGTNTSTFFNSEDKQ